MNSIIINVIIHSSASMSHLYLSLQILLSPVDRTLLFSEKLSNCIFKTNKHKIKYFYI